MVPLTHAPSEFAGRVLVAKLGSAVTVVEAEQRILPQYDEELARPVARRLKALGVKTLTSAKARGLSAKADALLVESATEEIRLHADKILLAVGRRPVLDGWGREELALDMNGKFIQIDDRCRTSMRGIYAIGDVTGEPMLAHRAMAQGEMVAEIVAGHRRSWDKRCIPAVCFTDPEIVAAGLSPEQARQSGAEVKIGQFPFSANGRARAMNETEGFVKILADAKTDRVLGAHIVGADAGTIIAELAMAIEFGASSEDIARTCHAHPTLNECVKEAALAVDGRPIHI